MHAFQLAVHTTVIFVRLRSALPSCPFYMRSAGAIEGKKMPNKYILHARYILRTAILRRVLRVRNTALAVDGDGKNSRLSLKIYLIGLYI